MRKVLLALLLALLLTLAPTAAFADGGISAGVTVLNPAPPYPFVVCGQTARI